MDDGVAWVEIHRCRELGECREFALVLAALDIDHWIDCEDESYGILVAPEKAARARVELAEYAAERQNWPPPEPSVPKIAVDIRDAVGYWVVLLVFYSLERHRALGLDWLRAGRAHAELICQGEWWRAFTALTLHADGPHLFNNLVFGSLFGLLLGHELGRGVTWLCVLLAGAAGNALNAYLQPASHLSIGASTGVFGAVGLLVVLQWRHYANREQLRRRWAPLIIGVVLLGYLGTSGERTDVVAHATGIASGAAFGAAFNAFGHRPCTRGWLQGVLEWGALLVLVLAWVYAFGR